MRPAHGTLRLTRTALLAGACTWLSWTGHNLSSATPAPAAGLVLATVLLVPVLWHFTKVMRGFTDIFAVLACAQLGLHAVLQGTGGPTPSFGAEHSGHGLLAHLVELGLAPGMLLAHLWAALLAAALLAHGESALWRLTALLSRALPPLLLVRTPPGPATTAPPAPPAAVPTASAAPSAHGPRAPPGSPRVPA
ncbi:hypothetical protein [Nocardiopsis sp. CNT312]|uniref:hypothetical protein n=1 Tax=Nocardiopsis sp. CNT312 TaxID=1137268 RepID=UPI00048DCE4A|nr:hypothetical protein [Nocardiopsis sp. CNT312]